MRKIKKIYARIFQQAFHISLPFLPFTRPEPLKTPRDVCALLCDNEISSVLLVTDKQLRGFGITNTLETELTEAGIKVAVFDGTRPNPTTRDVEQAYEVYKENDCNAIIGFGGGSAMDCAKACGIRVVSPNKPLGKYAGVIKFWKKLPLLIAVPTTAGTGSETTICSVIVDEETRHKYSISSFPLTPAYALLDPECTRSLPKSLTATTGLDALTHAVEAYIGKSTIYQSRRDALKAVSLIMKWLPEAYRDGNNMEAREGMLRGSYLAGNAFTRSFIGYVHAVAHSLGGKYNTPHGLANAVLLPTVLEMYGDKVNKKLAMLADISGISNEDDDAATAARKFIDRIKEMKKEFGIGDTIPELKEEDIPELSRTADKEANPMYPVPVLMDAKELAEIYYKILEK